MAMKTIWLWKFGKSREAWDEAFVVVHPLDDRPEEKVGNVNLGSMRMTPAVKISLAALRVYLILMTFMLIYHVMGLLGSLGHHTR